MPIVSTSASSSVAQNRAQLRASFRNEIKTDPNGKIWSDAEVNNFADIALLKLQRDGDFRWAENENGSTTFTLVAGTREYSLPSDFGRMELVQRSSDILEMTTFEDVRYHNPLDVQSTPNEYYLRGSNIGFDPVPNAGTTVNAYYRKRLPYLTSDVVTIVFVDPSFAHAIVKYMAYLAWSSPRGNKQHALEKLDDYKETLSVLRTAYLFRDSANLTLKIPRRFTNSNFPKRLY